MSTNRKYLIVPTASIIKIVAENEFRGCGTTSAMSHVFSRLNRDRQNNRLRFPRR